MKIVAVCSFGVGSSIIAKMNIDSIMEEEGRDDVTVETIDFGSVTSVEADYYVTTRELFDDFPDDIKEKTIVLFNFVDREDIKKHLDEKIGQ